jgi:two-component system, NarL family, response regulator
MEQFRLFRPDVTLMDLQMPTMNGTNAIAAIRNEFPGVRIVALTAYKGDIQTLRALKSGAVGYLLKYMLCLLLFQVAILRKLRSRFQGISPS